MDSEILVEGLLDDSIKLLKQLDSSILAPTTYVWYYYNDVDEWRLIIAGPSIDEYLPKKAAVAYQKISEIVSESDLNSLSIAQIKIIESSAPLIVAISMIVGTPPDAIMRVNFKNTTLNDMFIKDMVVVRSAHSIKRRL